MNMSYPNTKLSRLTNMKYIKSIRFARPITTYTGVTRDSVDRGRLF